MMEGCNVKICIFARSQQEAYLFRKVLGVDTNRVMYARSIERIRGFPRGTLVYLLDGWSHGKTPDDVFKVFSEVASRGYILFSQVPQGVSL